MATPCHPAIQVFSLEDDAQCERQATRNFAAAGPACALYPKLKHAHSRNHFGGGLITKYPSGPLLRNLQMPKTR